MACLLAVVACNGPQFYCGKEERTCHPDKDIAAARALPGDTSDQEVFPVATAWCFSTRAGKGALCYPTKEECSGVMECFEMKPDQHPEAGK